MRLEEVISKSFWMVFEKCKYQLVPPLIGQATILSTALKWQLGAGLPTNFYLPLLCHLISPEVPSYVHREATCERKLMWRLGTVWRRCHQEIGAPIQNVDLAVISISFQRKAQRFIFFLLLVLQKGQAIWSALQQSVKSQFLSSKTCVTSKNRWPEKPSVEKNTGFWEARIYPLGILKDISYPPYL